MTHAVCIWPEASKPRPVLKADWLAWWRTTQGNPISEIAAPGSIDSGTIDELAVLFLMNKRDHGYAPSPYEAFPPAEARRLVERFEWHYTPQLGSWLDLAESELGVLSTQCLERRIPDKPTLIDEIAAWQQERNANHTKADWHFTTNDARSKLKHLYPLI